MHDYQSSIYVWGSTAHCALGCLDYKGKVQLVPRRLNPCCTRKISGGSAIQVVAGNGFSTVVTDKWEAYSWGKGASADGKNGRGRSCGILPANTKSCSIRKVRLQNESVLGIAHGTGTCAVTLNGDVYGWGENTYGNLGDGDRPSNSKNDYGRQRFSAGSGGNEARRRFIASPRKIVLGDNVSKANSVACGEKHTCILKQNGVLVTMGANDAGQLGIGLSHNRHKDRNRVFNIIETIKRGPKMLNCVPFREIACGNNHSAAISSQDGSLYTWGWGKHGRLGHGNETLYNQPTYVEALSDFLPVAIVACGSAHTLAATNDGSVYGFGWNAHGQVIGTNEDREDIFSSDDCLSPVPCLTKKGVVKLSCSPFHSAAITLSGNLYLWGMNEDGQCGAGHELPILAPSRVDFQDAVSERYVVSVSCGHSHTVCILSNFLPLEATDLISRLQKYPSSAQIIVKFARHAIFRLHLLRLLQDKHTLVSDSNTPVIQTAEGTPSKELSEKELQLDDASSLSSHSSWSDDPYSLNAEAEPTSNALSQRLIEMQKMSDEDHRSSAHMSHLRALRQRVVEAEKLAMENKRMQKEDMLSRKLRAHTITSQKELKLKRSTKHKSKAATARDVRTNDQILKAAHRLKLARERREQQSNAKKTLPPVQRKLTKKKQHTNNKALHDIANSGQKSAAELARLQRRRKLVRRRESRLKIQEEMEKEAAQLRQQNLKANQEMDQLMKQKTQMKLEEEKRIAEDARKLQLMTEAIELQQLEHELKLNESCTKLRDNENKENEGTFHDLKHWTKSLSGVT